MLVRIPSTCSLHAQVQVRRAETPRWFRTWFFNEAEWWRCACRSDLKSMVLGFVFGCKAYLRKYPNFDPVTRKGLRISQRCIQQDCCEHHFANQRQFCSAGGHPDGGQANQGVNNSAYNHLSSGKVRCDSKTNVGRELAEQQGLTCALKRRRDLSRGTSCVTGKKHARK